MSPPTAPETAPAPIHLTSPIDITSGEEVVETVAAALVSPAMAGGGTPPRFAAGDRVSVVYDDAPVTGTVQGLAGGGTAPGIAAGVAGLIAAP